MSKVKVVGNRVELPYVRSNIIEFDNCSVMLQGYARAHFPEIDNPNCGANKMYSVFGFNFVTDKTPPKVFTVSYWADGDILSLTPSGIFSKDH